MEQPTFADLEYDGKKRKTRRERFLERMDGLIPWERLEDHLLQLIDFQDVRGGSGAFAVSISRGASEHQSGRCRQD